MYHLQNPNPPLDIFWVPKPPSHHGRSTPLPFPRKKETRKLCIYEYTSKKKYSKMRDGKNVQRKIP